MGQFPKQSSWFNGERVQAQETNTIQLHRCCAIDFPWGVVKLDDTFTRQVYDNTSRTQNHYKQPQSDLRCMYCQCRIPVGPGFDALWTSCDILPISPNLVPRNNRILQAQALAELSRDLIKCILWDEPFWKFDMSWLKSINSSCLISLMRDHWDGPDDDNEKQLV